MKIGWVFMFASIILAVNGVLFSLLSFSINKNSKSVSLSFLEYLIQERDVRSSFVALIFFSIFFAVLSSLFVLVDDKPADPRALRKYLTYLSLSALGGLNLYLRLFLISKINALQLQGKMSGSRTLKIAFSIGFFPKGHGLYSVAIFASQSAFIVVLLSFLFVR